MSRAVEVTGETVEAATLRALAHLKISPADAEVHVVDPGRRGLLRRPARVRVSVRADATGAGEALAETSSGAHDVLVADDAGDEHPETGTAGSEDAAADPPAAEGAEAMAPPAADDPVAAHDRTRAHDLQMSPQSDPHEEETVSETDTTAIEPSEDELSPEERMDQLDEEADLAADFVEGLLDHLDLPGDIEIEVQEEQAIVNLSEVGSGLLIGRRGATLDALQELVRCAVQRQTERRSHVRVDVEGYRERQIDKLRDKCRDAIAEARETGKPVRLEPMDAYERKMMHDLVSRTGGVTTTSEGAEPKRRVVIHPE